MSSEQDERRVFAAGDNSNGQLWTNKLIMSPHFIQCETFPCKASRVKDISAWGQSLAITDGSTVFYKGTDGDIQEYDV